MSKRIFLIQEFCFSYDGLEHKTIGYTSDEELAKKLVNRCRRYTCDDYNLISGEVPQYSYKEVGLITRWSFAWGHKTTIEQFRVIDKTRIGAHSKVN